MASNSLSKSIMANADAMMGITKISRNEVTSIIQTKRGSLLIVMPGVLIVRMVTMLFSPEATELIPVASKPKAQ